MTVNIDHDRLFKELLSTFFEEFILLFFPNIYEDINFQEFRFLSEERVTDVTEGEKYRIDLLIETKLKGEDGLILIHVKARHNIKRILTKECLFILTASMKSTA